MLSVILVQPEHASNVGAVARVMANFGVQKLIVVQPVCDILSNDAIQYAKHARNILKHATIVHSLDDVKAHTLVATTAKVGTDYHVARAPINPNQLSRVLSVLPKNTHVGLVFGREGEGLHNDELGQCDMVVSIPASPEYTTLNLSHAVGIVLYELFQLNAEQTTTSHIMYATKTERERVLVILEQALEFLQLPELKKNTQRTVWKHLLAKSCLTKREAYAIMGFLKKIQSPASKNK